MASGRAWKTSGDAQSSAVAVRRGASASRFSSRRSTRDPDTSPGLHAFPRSHRLTRGAELEIVRHQGKRLRTGSIDVRAVASLRAFPRVGFIVPRYKHSAVDRNRLKRRLRELVRLELLPALPPMDVVLRVAPHAYQRDMDALREEIRKAARGLATLTLPLPSAP